MNHRARKPKVSLVNKVVLESGVPSSQSVALSHSVGSDRTLYFHTGTHKTGSTALQVYLAFNRVLLGKAGVSYEFPPYTDQSMGNGQYFYDQIYERNTPDRQLEELLEFYLAGQTKAICSSEDFTRFRFQEWQKIKEACKRLQVKIKIVTFVRDIEPYYFSLHGQLTKGGESYGSYAEFCTRDQNSPVLDSLKCLIKTFGKESMSLIHYESAIGHIDTAFMQAIGADSESFDNASLKTTVNRSLVKYEQDVIAKINEATGRQYSYEISGLLMNKRPNLKNARQLDQEVIKTLLHRHAADVGWINQTFFDNANVVKVSENTSLDASNELDAKVQQAIARDVADWCITKLQSAQDNSIEYFSNRLNSIDWKNAANPAIPDNFDPIAYLLLNIDVLKAGIPPYEHFIASGQNENRKWKWKS
ncbi:hypothetical protein [Acinetobacter sp.]|uniref:hypothetical protein n=1 Tax=Acinetobacter sp. TaxID=472 RepID=UPI003750A592